MQQAIQLSDHFGYRRLIRFTLPSVFMMIITSVYGVVDGFFISNFVGKTSFAAVNFIMPFLMVVGALGFMFGAGGTALIAKTMGEGKSEKANRIFSMITYATVACGVLISAISILCIRPIASFLGGEGAMLENAVTYAQIILLSLPLLMVQYMFNGMVVAAGKPKLGLTITVVAGVTNMVGDAIFIVALDGGIRGAAMATALGELVGGVIPLVYFARKNTSSLKLGKATWDGKAMLKVCTNGSSELLNSISMSVVGMLYNAQLMKYAGENGIAAYGTIMYVNFIFISMFIGYSTGVAPVISFHYGAGNREELRGLLNKSAVIVLTLSALMLGISEGLASVLAGIFVGYDAELFAMTVHAFRVYAFSFLFAGSSIFGSAFFTALNDGLTSALISFLRTLVFQIASVMLLPLLLGLDGIWMSIIIAEGLAMIVMGICLGVKRKRYGY